MPNWCSNTVTIEGPKDQLDALAKKVSLPYETMFLTFVDGAQKHVASTVSGEFLLWNIVSPDDLEMYFSGSNWYEWNIEHFGTKWDVDASSERLSETSLVFQFESAWSPPLPALYALSEQWPDLTVSAWFSEAGMNFEGEHTVKGGQAVSVQEGQCRDRWCEACDSHYRVDSYDYAGPCPVGAASAPGTHMARLHAVNGEVTTASELEAIVRSTSSDLADGETDVKVLVLAAYNKNLNDSSLAYLANCENDEVAEAAFYALSGSRLTAFQASGDPDLERAASRALVFRAGQDPARKFF